MSRVNVDVVYVGGLDWDLDRLVDELMGKESNGGGCCMFGEGERDRQFSFSSKKKANETCKVVVDTIRGKDEYKNHKFKVFINGEEVQ